jgi:hypothetical protein
MNGKMALTGLGLLMMVLSLAALAGGTDRALDAQCRRRCNCTNDACGSIMKCQDSSGVWTKCCEWCST